jgi:hypothetical protein
MLISVGDLNTLAKYLDVDGTGSIPVRALYERFNYRDVLRLARELQISPHEFANACLTVYAE